MPTNLPVARRTWDEVLESIGYACAAPFLSAELMKGTILEEIQLNTVELHHRLQLTK